MVTATQITAAELEEMPDGERFELVRGAIREISPTGGRHGWLQVELLTVLNVFVKSHGLGRVYTESGFIVQHGPDTVLAPDLAFVQTGRLLPEHEQIGFLDQAPDLAVEIVSPGDRAGQVLEKVMTYLDAEVRLVWTVDPQRQRIVVWDTSHPVRELGPEQTLDGGEVLPGFLLPLVELFGSSSGEPGVK